MKLLVIGGTGFIGSQVTRLLVATGNDVVLFHRGTTIDRVVERAGEIHGDRDRLRGFHDEIARLEPDVILDMILYTEQQAVGLIEVAAVTGARVVAASSADVYRNYDGLQGRPTAPPDPVPLDERAPLRESRYPYRGHDVAFAYANDYEKILVEEVLTGHPRLEATLLRLPAVYGPGDRQRRIRPYLQKMLQGDPVIRLAKSQAEWRWTRGFVENVAAAIACACLDRGAASRTFNVGDEPCLTEREWVERIGATVGWLGKVVIASEQEPGAEGFDWSYHLWTDTSALRTSLGFVAPVGTDEAIRLAVEDERSALARGEHQ